VVLKLPLCPPVTVIAPAQGALPPELVLLEEELVLLEEELLLDELDELVLDDELLDELDEVELVLDDELLLLEELPVVTSKLNALVVSPIPPFQISKPASTSMRYQLGLM
jgi:hypothetical protein